MDQKKSMPQGAKIAVTILNVALILAGIVMMLVLAVGTVGAKSGGTFGLFGGDTLDRQSAGGPRQLGERILDLALSTRHLLSGHASFRAKADAHQAWPRLDRARPAKRSEQKRLS